MKKVLLVMFILICVVLITILNSKNNNCNLQGTWDIIEMPILSSSNEDAFPIRSLGGYGGYYSQNSFILHKNCIEIPKGVAERRVIYSDVNYFIPYQVLSNKSISFYSVYSQDWSKYDYCSKNDTMTIRDSNSQKILLKAKRVKIIDDTTNLTIDSIGVEIEHDTYVGIVNTTIGISNTFMSVCTTNDMATGHQRYNEILNYHQQAYLNRLASMVLTETKDTIYPARASDMPDYKIHILTQNQAKLYVVDGGYYSAPFCLGALILYIDNLVGKITVVDSPCK